MPKPNAKWLRIPLNIKPFRVHRNRSLKFADSKSSIIFSPAHNAVPWKPGIRGQHPAHVLYRAVQRSISSMWPRAA